MAERVIALPNESSIKAAAPAWVFPKDAVFAKTLSLDMQHGNPSSRRRIETQLLHFDGIDWQTYSYQWNDEQSDAVLLAAAGAERTFDIVDAATPGGKRQQTWRFSGRAECQRCHNKWSGSALGFTTPQLNNNHDYGGASASQLDTLAHIKIFDRPLPTEKRPQLANPRDPTADQDGRARAYLHANCAHCHRQHAGGAVLAKMHFDLPLEKTDLVNFRPPQGTFGIHAALVTAPANRFRMQARDFRQQFQSAMPETLGLATSHPPALLLVQAAQQQIELPMIVAIRMVTRPTGRTATLVNRQFRCHRSAPFLGVADSLLQTAQFTNQFLDGFLAQRR